MAPSTQLRNSLRSRHPCKGSARPRRDCTSSPGAENRACHRSTGARRRGEGRGRTECHGPGREGMGRRVNQAGLHIRVHPAVCKEALRERVGAGHAWRWRGAAGRRQGEQRKHGRWGRVRINSCAGTGWSGNRRQNSRVSRKDWRRQGGS